MGDSLMKRNVEIKARARNMGVLVGRSEAIADSGPEILHQEDTFFHSSRGRLKLRKFSDAHGELIFYDRPDSMEPTECRYLRCSTSNPDELLAILSESVGCRGTVKKRRTLYIVDQTRIHLDEVDNVGQFVELEVVLRTGQSSMDGVRIAHELMKDLGISKHDLLESAYIDMLEDGAA
jgi:predicted adenylyl cyclase CyaB